MALRSTIVPALLVYLLLFQFSAFSQTSPSLRINNVIFSLERSPYGGNPWLEMDIEVDVRGNPSSSAANRDFVDDLVVEVALAQNLGTPSQPRLEYLWTRIELPTLERGSRHLRFYLSPEQVERGRIINNDPYAWYVRIAGNTEEANSGQTTQDIVAVSANLREQPRLDRFLDLLEEQKDQRSGILLPQAETPFRDAYPDDTPIIKGQDRND